MGTGSVHDGGELVQLISFKIVAQTCTCIAEVKIQGEGSAWVCCHSAKNDGGDVVSPFEQEFSMGVVGCDSVHRSPEETQHV